MNFKNWIANISLWKWIGIFSLCIAVWAVFLCIVYRSCVKELAWRVNELEKQNHALRTDAMKELSRELSYLASTIIDDSSISNKMNTVDPLFRFRIGEQCDEHMIESEFGKIIGTVELGQVDYKYKEFQLHKNANETIVDFTMDGKFVSVERIIQCSSEKSAHIYAANLLEDLKEFYRDMLVSCDAEVSKVKITILVEERTVTAFCTDPSFAAILDENSNRAHNNTASSDKSNVSWKCKPAP